MVLFVTENTQSMRAREEFETLAEIVRKGKPKKLI